jgi:hypothetical protein
MPKLIHASVPAFIWSIDPSLSVGEANPATIPGQPLRITVANFGFRDWHFPPSWAFSQPIDCLRQELANLFRRCASSRFPSLITAGMASSHSILGASAPTKVWGFKIAHV